MCKVHIHSGKLAAKSQTQAGTLCEGLSTRLQYIFAVFESIHCDLKMQRQQRMVFVFRIAGQRFSRLTASLPFQETS